MTPVVISLVGKYTNLSDAYLSIIKSLQHSCMEARVKLQVGTRMNPDVLWGSFFATIP